MVWSSKTRDEQDNEQYWHHNTTDNQEKVSATPRDPEENFTLALQV